MAKDDRERSQASADAELKVTDRRLFTADGELRDEGVPEEAPEDSQETGPSETRTVEQGFERRPVEEPRGVDFTMLINAMAEPALVFLGEIQHPSTGKPTVDLERARIQIDMLDVLRVKCRGNLTPEEEGLLDRMLYQLRMLYVSRANQPET
jgi:hypothetical protein